MPQGSVLSPVLFSVHINVVSAVIKNSKFNLYADDLLVYIQFTVTDFLDSVHTMNIEIDAIAARWAFKNILMLNESKSQPILIRNHTRLGKTNLDNFNLKVFSIEYELMFVETLFNIPSLQLLLRYCQ